MLGTKVDFRYDFEIPGFEKIDGQGNILISGEPEIEKIKEVVSQYISDKIRDHKVDADINVLTNVEIINSFTIRNDVKITPLQRRIE